MVLPNPRICRFIWEHCNDVNHVLHHLGHARATVSATKLFACRPEVIIVGQMCNYKGHVPDDSKVTKIHHWPSCQTKTDIHSFLSTAGTVHNWIKDFAAIVRPLMLLTKKIIPFTWGETEQILMDKLKAAVASSPVICPIDYSSANEVVLAVDSSRLAVKYVLY